MGSQDYATHFLDLALFQNMVHIDDILLIGDTQVVMGILFSSITHWPSNFTQTVISSSFFFVSFGKFRQKNYACMWRHYGFKIVGVFLRPLSEASSLTINILWWYRLPFYGILCPVCFLRCWALVHIYVIGFCIFDKPILKEYVFQNLRGFTLASVMFRSNVK